MRPLPGELVPLVLAQLAWRTADLARCCLVCRWWYHHAVPLLYERLWLRDQTRLVRVFQTLASAPALARWLRIVELRVFPFGMPAERLEELEAHIVQALQHATHLRVLAWTRTGSLSDRVLVGLFDKMTCLERLELTGNTRTWSPAVLARHMPRTVTELSFVLPDRALAEHLVALVARLDGRLRRLTLLCLDSSVVTDALLVQLAPHAPRLTSLTLVGCKQVHGPGVHALVSPALRELALEAVALAPDELVALAPRVSQVERLTLTTPRRLNEAPAFFAASAHLVDTCSGLRYLTMYARGGRAPGGPSEAPTHTADPAPQWRLDPGWLERLCMSRSATTLQGLQIHGLAVSQAQLTRLAAAPLATHLHELAVYVVDAEPEALARAVRSFPALRLLHWVAPAESALPLEREDLDELLAHAGPWLQQVGVGNRVWLVHTGPAGRMLVPWDMARGTFPSTMLVVRS